MRNVPSVSPSTLEPIGVTVLTAPNGGTVNVATSMRLSHPMYGS